MKAPEKIYLQACGDCKDNDCENCKFKDLEEITWCRDKIFEKDIEYTRTDSLPSWKKSTLPNNNVIGINSEYLCYKGYIVNYKELFDKLPKED